MLLSVFYKRMKIFLLTTSAAFNWLFYSSLPKLIKPWFTWGEMDNWKQTFAMQAENNLSAQNNL